MQRGAESGTWKKAHKEEKGKGGDATHKMAAASTFPFFRRAAGGVGCLKPTSGSDWLEAAKSAASIGGGTVNHPMSCFRVPAPEGPAGGGKRGRALPWRVLVRMECGRCLPEQSHYVPEVPRVGGDIASLCLEEDITSMPVFDNL